MSKSFSQLPTTAQSLGARLKSARDIMRKDKGLNGDLDRLPMADVLKVPPVSDHGQIGDITKLFGGADKLRGAVNELQTLLYAA